MSDVSMTGGRSWRKWLLIAGVVLAVASFIDAFFVDKPVAAIVYALLVAGGAYWLSRSDGRGPVIFLGVLMLLELLAVLFVYPDEGEALDARSLLFAAITAVGAVAATVALIRPFR